MASGFLLVPRIWRRRLRLVLWGGEVRAARHRRLAGQVMLDFAGSVVCRADGFRIGRPAPVLAIEDRLVAGRTYVVLPVDRLPRGCDVELTAASLAALFYDRGAAPAICVGAMSPFEHVRGDDGRTVIIKVRPEFVVAAVTAGIARGGGPALCSTPELRLHYDQLVVAARGWPWSPRLDTIEERRRRSNLGYFHFGGGPGTGRLSPATARLLGLDGGKGER